MAESTTSTTGWEQYSEAGRTLLAQGEHARAAEAFAAAARAAERDFGAESLQLATALGALGQISYQQRQHAAAAEHFGRALAIRDRVLGADHIGVAQSVNNLAAVHVATNDLERAEPLLRRALAITERLRGPLHADLAVNLNNLAKLYFKRGDLGQAEPLLQRLLVIKRAQGSDNPEVATVLASLATLQQTLGDHAGAERLWREALSIRERATSPTDAALAPLLEQLAECCGAQGRRADELELRQRALGIREDALGADHPSVTAARAKVVALRQAAPNAPAPGHRPMPARVDRADDAVWWTPQSATPSQLGSPPGRTPVAPPAGIEAAWTPPPAQPAAPPRVERTDDRRREIVSVAPRRAVSRSGGRAPRRGRGRGKLVLAGALVAAAVAGGIYLFATGALSLIASASAGRAAIARASARGASALDASVRDASNAGAPVAGASVARAPVAGQTPAASPPPASPSPTPPGAPAPVVSRSLPGPDVPSGPAVAPLPVSRVAAKAPADSRRRSAEPAAESSQPLAPIRTISLDGLTKDIDAKTRSRLDAETRAVVKPTDFKQPAPHR